MRKQVCTLVCQQCRIPCEGTAYGHVRFEPNKTTQVEEEVFYFTTWVCHECGSVHDARGRGILKEFDHETEDETPSPAA